MGDTLLIKPSSCGKADVVRAPRQQIKKLIKSSAWKPCQKVSLPAPEETPHERDIPGQSEAQEGNGRGSARRAPATLTMVTSLLLGEQSRARRSFGRGQRKRPRGVCPFFILTSQ